MARPKKDTELCAERRILDAFWHVLESTPLRCVSVRTVAQTAEVNRGTFYYHFKSVDALVDRAIESELLERHSIVHEVLLMTTGEIDRMPLDSMQRHIERTVLLVRQGGGEHVMNVVFDIFRNIWRAVLCPNGEALSPQVEMLIRYNAHGILGCIPRWRKVKTGSHRKRRWSFRNGMLGERLETCAHCREWSKALCSIGFCRR